jgi:hypothetical protein
MSVWKNKNEDGSTVWESRDETQIGQTGDYTSAAKAVTSILGTKYHLFDDKEFIFGKDEDYTLQYNSSENKFIINSNHSEVFSIDSSGLVSITALDTGVVYLNQELSISTGFITFKEDGDDFVFQPTANGAVYGNNTSSSNNSVLFIKNQAGAGSGDSILNLGILNENSQAYIAFQDYTNPSASSYSLGLTDKEFILSTTFLGVDGIYGSPIITVDDNHEINLHNNVIIDSNLMLGNDNIEDILDDKVNSSQVLTDVPLNAVFTDTTYSVGDGGLTQKNFTTALETKLDGIEALADVTDTTNVVAALTAGTNVTIAGDGTISSTDTNTTYSVGDGGLTQNNFTDTLKGKLDNIAENANNYTHPANHAPSIITQDSSNRFVTDTEKATWNAKQDALSNVSDGTGGEILLSSNLKVNGSTITSVSDDSDIYINPNGSGDIILKTDSATKIITTDFMDVMDVNEVYTLLRIESADGGHGLKIGNSTGTTALTTIASNPLAIQAAGNPLTLDGGAGLILGQYIDTSSLAVKFDTDGMSSDSDYYLASVKNIKSYVDGAIGDYLPLSGGTMTGSIAIGGYNLTEVGQVHSSSMEVFRVAGNAITFSGDVNVNSTIKSSVDLTLQPSRESSGTVSLALQPQNGGTGDTEIALSSDKVTGSAVKTDLSADSDNYLVTQQAVKTYVDDNAVSKITMSHRARYNCLNTNYYYVNGQGSGSTFGTSTNVNSVDANNRASIDYWRSFRLGGYIIPMTGKIESLCMMAETSSANGDCEFDMWTASGLDDGDTGSSTVNLTWVKEAGFSMTYAANRHEKYIATGLDITVNEGDYVMFTARRTSSNDGSYYYLTANILIEES